MILLNQEGHNGKGLIMLLWFPCCTVIWRRETELGTLI